MSKHLEIHQANGAVATFGIDDSLNDESWLAVFNSQLSEGGAVEIEVSRDEWREPQRISINFANALWWAIVEDSNLKQMKLGQGLV